jgi:hypothetical protein
MSTVNVNIVFIQSIGRSSVDCCCTKGVTRSQNSKRTQYNGRQKKNNTNNDLINTTQKTKIEQHEPHKNNGSVYSGSPEGRQFLLHYLHTSCYS